MADLRAVPYETYEASRRFSACGDYSSLPTGPQWQYNDLAPYRQPECSVSVCVCVLNSERARTNNTFLQLSSCSVTLQNNDSYLIVSFHTSWFYVTEAVIVEKNMTLQQWHNLWISMLSRCCNLKHIEIESFRSKKKKGNEYHRAGGKLLHCKYCDYKQ